MRHIKKTVQCPGCQNSFVNHDIDIVELHDDGMLLYVECPRCHTELEMEIGIQGGNLIPTIHITSEHPVTKEDVDKVAKQLARHKGAITSLFTVKKKKTTRKKKKEQ